MTPQLELVDITPDNWRAFARLTVTDEQSPFVASNPLMLARAYAYRHEGSQVWGVQQAGQPIGLLLERDYHANGKGYCDLDQFMIAGEFQGHGYGLAALKLWLQQVRQQGKHKAVILCYVRGNDSAAKLFSSVGFQPTGEEDGDEIVMELALT